MSVLPFFGRVRPGEVTNNVVHRLYRTWVLAGQLILGFTACMTLAYFTHVCPGQVSQAVMLTPVTLTITNSILPNVLSSCAPAEIYEPSVALATGTVPCFLFFRTRANKRFKHQVMNAGSTPTPVCPVKQIHLWVAVLADVLGKKLATANSARRLMGNRSYVTLITDFVEAFPGRNTPPVFVHVDTNVARNELIPAGA